MENTPISERLIRRIRKMLALARDSAASEGEVNNAMAMVSELLLKHDLAMADVETGAGAGAADGGVGSRAVGESVIRFGPRSAQWKGELVEAVAKINFCKVLEPVYDKGKIVGYGLIGHATNVEVVTMLLGWLFGQIERISRDQYDQHRYGRTVKKVSRDPETLKVVITEEYVPRRTWSTLPAWSKSFGIGAVNRLKERLYEEAERRKGNDQVQALVVSVEQDIRDYMEAKYPWRKEQRIRQEQYAAEMKAAREERERWEAEHPEEAEAQRARARQERAETDERWRKEYAARQRKREAYEERYYRQHGHYPGEGRRGEGRVRHHRLGSL